MYFEGVSRYMIAVQLAQLVYNFVHIMCTKSGDRESGVISIIYIIYYRRRI